MLGTCEVKDERCIGSSDGLQTGNGDRSAVSQREPILSPLRYPGSKRRLVAYIRAVLQMNGLRPELLVEPFAGGASVALQLLHDGVVERIGLADKDPMIAAFWKTVFWDSDWLIEQVCSIDVSLHQWMKLKKADHLERRERALACLFLNRTSFSGILAPGAGPIGGRQQASDYGISCRFPREKLARRIRQAAELRGRVAFVWQTSWHETLHRIGCKQRERKLSDDVFYYFDPPFFEKADRLYRFSFRDADHAKLRDAVLKLDKDWLLSYDSAERVSELYSHAKIGPRHIGTIYTTSARNGRGAAREVLLSNLARLPEIDKLCRLPGDP